MVRRPLRRHFNQSDLPKVIEAIGEVRRWLGNYSAGQKFNSPEREKCDAFFKALDDVTEMLTGKRDYFQPPFFHTGLFMKKKAGE